jgi:single-strand selective monofunctional uracil DNA glycosylase
MPPSPQSLASITDELLVDLAPMGFSEPVTHVYNPLIYARAAWDAYCERFGAGPKQVLMLGMNPGPCGLSNPG